MVVLEIELFVQPQENECKKDVSQSTIIDCCTYLHAGQLNLRLSMIQLLAIIIAFSNRYVQSFHNEFCI